MKNFLLVFLLLPAFFLSAQVAPKKPNAAQIYEMIEKLNVLGSVLYVAAHPDDENTRLISYLSNNNHYETTYLSLTRGDGGQNLIGSELRELLGVLRTQELLMARNVDGGKQLFSRANDFGFSKNADETLEIWDKEQVLADAVYAIRKVQPDVIINRFSTDKKIETHGHHTTSAIIADTAFSLAGNKKAFPEQLAFYPTWQPKRLFFNTSWFFYGSQEKFNAMDKSNLVTLDIGTYLPLKGKSNNEVAAESRSMHRCQGFGSLSVRGADMDYLDYLKGDLPKPKNNDIFEGINTTWTRLEGGEAIGKILAAVQKNYQIQNPSASLPDLLKAYDLIQKLPESYWKRVKFLEIKKVIEYCAGLYVETAAKDYSAVTGQNIELNAEIVSRSDARIVLKSVTFGDVAADTVLNKPLEANKKITLKRNFKIAENTPLTAPYWLNDKATLGMYNVSEQAKIGLPETPRAIRANYELTINDYPFMITKDVIYREGNPSKGEIYRPLEIIPPVFTNINEKVTIFQNNDPKTVHITVRAGKEKLEGSLSLTLPKYWRAEPSEQAFNIAQKNEEKVLTFKVFPPENQSEGSIKAVATVNGKRYENALKIIEYDHIPTQTVLLPAEAKVVKLQIEKRGEKIGYLMGAGDEVPQSLEQIGYQITNLEEKNFTDADGLKGFDAIVVGIRAYNTKEKLKFWNAQLLEYVKNGGTLIVQYNTNGRDLIMTDFAPYTLKLSRERTTKEEAEVRFLKPEHPILNTPNKITKTDFEGWVQERGLYFPSEWTKDYDALLSCNDPSEPARDGGLLVAKYGKGYYIYTGYSWFRQLPAGVSGAYRLFANILSVGKN